MLPTLVLHRKLKLTLIQLIVVIKELFRQINDLARRKCFPDSRRQLSDIHLLVELESCRWLRWRSAGSKCRFGYIVA